MTERADSGSTIPLRPSILLLLLFMLAGPVMPSVQSQSDAQQQAVSDLRSVEPATEGALLYADHCSVCHGATGLGLAEAKEAFPPDHRRCVRCHKSGNPPIMNLAQVERRQHDLFDVGNPPPLRGEGAMADHAAPQALRAYIAAAMPRYRPGALTAEEYDALAAFLLQLNDR